MKFEGIVINSNQYKDNDLIASLLTETGFQVFKAKGVKKSTSKNRFLLFDLSIVQVELFEKGDKKTLINGKLLCKQNLLYSDYYGLIFISFIKELILKLLIDEEKRLIYSKLKYVLEDISKQENIETFRRLTLKYIVYIFLHILSINGIDYLNSLNSKEKVNEYSNFLKNNCNNLNISYENLKKMIQELSIFVFNCTSVEILSLKLL